MDAGNYFPERDGVIAALESGSATSSGLLQERLPKARVVKAFNHIRSAELTADARESGSPDRRALVVAGDDPRAGAAVAGPIDEFGFGPLDIGPLPEGWRVQAGTPAFCARLTRDELTATLGDTERPGAPA